MKLLDICQRSNINCPHDLEKIEIKGITSSSKKVGEGYLFVCLEGVNDDGHRYVDDALACGASAVVIQNEKYLCDHSILVKDTRAALANMMNVFCGEPTKELSFIGITGTNGKTSVSVMIKNIFDTLHIPCEVIGTLNCSSFSENHDDSQTNFTTPDPEELYPMLRRILDGGVRYVVMETSSHALKLKKLDPITFKVGIFTNLTEDHLDFHHSMDDYFASKLRLFDRCELGIINIDDEYGRRVAALAPCKIKTCSTERNADYLVEDISDLCEKGTAYTLKGRGNELRLWCKSPGKFSIMNSMQASACALELDIDKKDIIRSFECFNGVKGRLEAVALSEGRDFAAYIDYAHTPDALQKLLDTANSIKGNNGRVILLFGCGGNRETQKRKIMGEIATENADVVIITSDNPRSEDPMKIIDDILLGTVGKNNYTVIPNRKRAIEYALATAKRGDIVLFAGKGHENYEINASGRAPFDEREIIRGYFEKITKRRNEL